MTCVGIWDLHSNSLLDTKAWEGHPDRKPLQLYALTFDIRSTKYKQISEIKKKIKNIAPQ